MKKHLQLPASTIESLLIMVYRGDALVGRNRGWSGWTVTGLRELGERRGERTAEK